MKIAVLGYSGSGKSTLTKYLSEYFEIPLLYLDTIQFEGSWIYRDRNEAKNMVKDFLKNNNDWAIDGNYEDFSQEERLKDADLIVYLCFNRFSCLHRALKRYKKYKNKTRESISKDCTEKFDLEFLWWILHQSRNKKTRDYYNNVFKDYKHKLVVIKNQKQLDAFKKNPRQFIK